MRLEPLHRRLWLALLPIVAWSFVGCHDRFTWALEAAPVFIGSAVLLAIYRRFRFGPLVSWLLFAHAVVLLVGGHYTYAKVPLFDLLRDLISRSRNDYDRLGHLMQGFVPAMVAREVLLRRGVLGARPSRGWLFFLVACICLAFSASYELFEAGTAMLTGSKADAFLGSQGDPFDTQWDMACALIGAVTAQLLLAQAHDRELAARAKA